MFNLSHLIAGMTPLGWVMVVVGLTLWIAMTYLMGLFSEKKWGDRESGALVGFFVPGLVFVLLLYWF